MEEERSEQPMRTGRKFRKSGILTKKATGRKSKIHEMRNWELSHKPAIKEQIYHYCTKGNFARICRWVKKEKNLSEEKNTARKQAQNITNPMRGIKNYKIQKI